MNLRDFRRAGHFPTLLCAFLYFDISFMIWVLIGALGVSVSKEVFPVPAGADPVAHAKEVAPYVTFMLAVPTLAGALLRLVLGVMADRWSGRKTAILGMCLTAIPLLLGVLWAHTFAEMILVGILLGIGGASFAVALPLASRWYPPQYQGLAMGIAGAGNSGTALATFFGPMLAVSTLAGLFSWVPGLANGLATTFGLHPEAQLGWRAVFGLALVPLAMTLVLFVLFAKDSPTQPPPKPLGAYAAMLGFADTWWFCLFYSMTFGGFVGLAVFLNKFFTDQYTETLASVYDALFGANEKSLTDKASVLAGYFTTLCVVSGSFLRPVGGYFADRVGGIRMLMVLYSGVALALGLMYVLPPLWAGVTLLFVAMGCLGMGNGSVFQLVPQRFPKEIGVVTGIVGAAGGMGGFFLPNVFGLSKRWTGNYALGFVVFAVLPVVCMICLSLLRARWEATFLAQLKATQAPVPEPQPVVAPEAGGVG
jgi:MFS transporter, NNP family, nitrate/nitrite transporter